MGFPFYFLWGVGVSGFCFFLFFQWWAGKLGTVERAGKRGDDNIKEENINEKERVDTGDGAEQGNTPDIILSRGRRFDRLLSVRNRQRGRGGKEEENVGREVREEEKRRGEGRKGCSGGCGGEIYSVVGVGLELVWSSGLGLGPGRNGEGISSVTTSFRGPAFILGLAPFACLLVRLFLLCYLPPSFFFSLYPLSPCIRRLLLHLRTRWPTGDGLPTLVHGCAQQANPLRRRVLGAGCSSHGHIPTRFALVGRQMDGPPGDLARFLARPVSR